MIKKTLFFAFIYTVFSNPASAETHTNIQSLDEYRNNIKTKEQRGGTLYCNDNSYQDFKDCESFYSLKNNGCYGNDTQQIGIELFYAQICKELNALKNATVTQKNYFHLESEDWWRSLPADVIPMPGGVQSDESWNQAGEELDNLIRGKSLGQVNFEEITINKLQITAIIKSKHEACGITSDVLNLSAVLLIDFDNDGVEELLLKGSRMSSGDCSGSGNSLGANFSVLLKKAKPEENIKVIEFIR